MQKGPWEDWYHCMCNTYGTWLRGSKLGWHERHHRKHVDGDYKRPPKKRTFEGILKRSKQLMKRDPVYLEGELRRMALLTVVNTLRGDSLPLLVACLNAHHLHVLVQVKDHRPRHYLGWAKFYATKEVKRLLTSLRPNDHGAAVGSGLELKPGEGIWGKRSQCVPIRECSHRLHTLQYLADHWKQNAFVWLDPSLPRIIPHEYLIQ